MRNPLKVMTSSKATAWVGAVGLVLLAFSGFATATEITSVQGPAYVTRGTASIPVTKGMKLEVGDRVVVLDQSEVQILYTDGCVEPLASKSTQVTITSESPCAARSRVAGNKPAEAAPATSASTSGASSGAAEGEESASQGSTGQTIVTIAAILLPLAVVLSTNQSLSNSRPLSP